MHKYAHLSHFLENFFRCLIYLPSWFFQYSVSYRLFAITYFYLALHGIEWFIYYILQNKFLALKCALMYLIVHCTLLDVIDVMRSILNIITWINDLHNSLLKLYKRKMSFQIQLDVSDWFITRKNCTRIFMWIWGRLIELVLPIW